jgi:hypothetical protein
MADHGTVHELFWAVMADVRAIEKGDMNKQQGFRFRGIDAVMQEVGPALRAHGVHIIPTPLEMRSETYETAKGTAMRNVTVTMQYTVFGPQGDSFVGGAIGEAADSGDKAVTKAQSVAYRTFLLTALTVPTGDVDPDAQVHERVSERPRDPADVARDQLLRLVNANKLDPRKLGQRFLSDYGIALKDADVETVRGFISIVTDEVEAAAGD